MRTVYLNETGGQYNAGDSHDGKHHHVLSTTFYDEKDINIGNHGLAAASKDVRALLLRTVCGGRNKPSSTTSGDACKMGVWDR